MPPSENSETQKYNLPPPVNETAGETANDSQETAPSSPETAKNIKAPKISSARKKLNDFQVNNYVAPQAKTVATSTAVNDNPQVAEDNDLIEKEWVAKAKKIIEDNREDPHNQSKEITLFKADYMMKRYNKAVKVSE